MISSPRRSSHLNTTGRRYSVLLTFGIGALAIAGILLTAPTSDAAPQGPWKLPASSISVPSPLTESPQIAIGPHGSVTAVWSRVNEDGFSIIQAATRTPGGGWSDPVDLSLSGRNAHQPQIAASNTGETVAVWRRSNGSNTIIQATIRTVNGEFPDPGAAKNLSGIGQNATNPKLTVADDGTTTVVWQRSNGSNSIIQALTRTANMSFPPPGDAVDLSLAGQNAFDPQIATGADGTTTVIWRRWNGDDFIAQATSRAGIGDFPAPAQAINLSEIGDDANHPSLAVGPNGTFAATWSRYWQGTIFVQVAIRYPNHDWSPPDSISESGANAGFAQVAFGPDNSTTVVWDATSVVGHTVRALTRPAGQSFPPTEEIETLSALAPDVFHPQLTIGPDGSTTVIWQRTDTDTLTEATTRPEGQHFPLPSQVTNLSEPASGSSYPPQVAIAPNGITSAVWVQQGPANSTVKTASTSLPNHALSTELLGNGTGTISSNPAGISCGDHCSETFVHGTEVLLAAVAETESKFAGWGGACSGTTLTCQVVMDQAKSVTATFAKKPTKLSPTLTTAVFDGTRLHIRARCPDRFKPRCVAVVVPITSKKVKTVKGERRLVGKPMAASKKTSTLAGRWRHLSFLIKPAYRAKISDMADTGKRALHVRQAIRSKKIGIKKNSKISRVLHSYMVREE